MLKSYQLCLLLALVAVGQAAITADLVVGLESQTANYTKPWYSGFLSASFQQTELHYWFFPSQGNPTTDPLLLWLNGGPGCSSLLGALQEHGPFVFLSNSTTMVLNPYAWNTNANVIYLESPAGVGFSYSGANQWAWNDFLTAEINLQALQSFFGGFPEFKTNPFFIAGESYAGMYIPYLATAIDTFNSYNPDDLINFKGIAVGNGCTHPLECGLGSNVDIFQANTLWNQGMYDPELREQFIYNCLNNQSQLATSACENTYNQIMTFLGNEANYNTANIYDLIGLCFWQSLPNGASHGQAQWLHAKKEAGANGTPVPGLPPCTDGVGPYTFLNNPTVQEAIHVNQTVPVEWLMCAGSPFSYNRSSNGSYGLYPNLIRKGYRIWIYSGDTDGAVPTAGTYYWTTLLANTYGLDVVTPWRAWYQAPLPTDPNQNNRQNAGQFYQVQGLTLVTFKGVGHMVPQYNRQGALAMLTAFFAGGELPAL